MERSMKNLYSPIRNRLALWAVFASALSLIVGSPATAGPLFDEAPDLTCEERLFLCHQEEARLEAEKRQCESDKRTCPRRLENCQRKLARCQGEAERYRQMADACEGELVDHVGRVADGEHSMLRATESAHGPASRLQSIPPIGIDVVTPGQIGNLFCEAQLSVCRISVGIKEGELERCRDQLADMPCTQDLENCEVDVEFCEEERDHQKRRWLECRALKAGR